MKVAQNNYPIIVWYTGKEWIDSIPYVIYKADNNDIYMCNLNESIKVSIKEFWNNYSGYAIVYGKYW